MVCVLFYVICIVELLVSSVICRFQGLSYLHVPDCIRVFFYFVNSSRYSLLRLRRKLLRSSTRMRLPVLNSVRVWARLFHVSASGGLRPIAAEPQSAQGGIMEQSRWAKICHFGEVGH